MTIQTILTFVAFAVVLAVLGAAAFTELLGRIGDARAEARHARNKTVDLEKALTLAADRERLQMAWARIADLEKQCLDLQDQCAKLRALVTAGTPPTAPPIAKTWREVQQFAAVDELAELAAPI